MPDLPPDEPARSIVARSILAAAVTIARAGDPQTGRERCATVMFELLPVLARRQDLLVPLLHTLLVCHGFRLAARLVMAMSGRRLRIMLRADAEGPVGPPHCQEEPWEVICPIDPRWLERLRVDDPYLRRWGEALAAGRGLPAETPAAMPVPLRAVHV
ncbi:MAG: hypothetical protein WDN25_10045 [Acetobacteraceae bacterium]